MWAGATWPVLIPRAAVMIGTRQLGLFVLMHDAAYGSLHRNRRVNDWLTTGLQEHPLVADAAAQLHAGGPGPVVLRAQGQPQARAKVGRPPDAAGAWPEATGRTSPGR